MKLYRFVFERGTMEGEGEDVVQALAGVLKEMNTDNSLSTPLGWLETFTEVTL